MPFTLCSNPHQYMRILVVSYIYVSKHISTWILKSFLPPAPSIKQFATERMDEGKRLSVEAQQTQEQPATIKFVSAVAVAYLDECVQRKHSGNNQDFINEYEVTLCVWYFSGVVVNMHMYKMFSPSTMAVRNPLL